MSIERLSDERVSRAVDLLAEADAIASRPTDCHEDHYGRVVVIGSKVRAALAALRGQ